MENIPGHLPLTYICVILKLCRELLWCLLPLSASNMRFHGFSFGNFGLLLVCFLLVFSLNILLLHT